MTTISQTFDWFISGFTGTIPVWNKAGQQIGYRKSYDSMTIYFLEGFNNMQPGTELITKNFQGQDIPLKTTAAPQTVTSSGQSQTTAPVAQVTVPVAQPSTTVTTPMTLLSTLAMPVNIAGLKIPVWVFVAGGGGLLIYLATRK
ncbi:MAG: hypothetical protein V4563_17280 [Pseudomonadota bacterium]